MYVDADTHVDECEETWEFVPDAYHDLRPLTVEITDKDVPPWFIVPGSESRHTRQWLIDGQVFPRRIRSDERTGTTRDTRELHDVPARVKDMDDLSVEHQVLYPTTLLGELSLRPEVNAAICHSYNAWIADRCAQSHGRLRWVAMLPMISVPHALEEMDFAKKNGAVGVFKRAIECRELPASDAHFDPIYDLAAQLQLPMCMHIGSAWRPTHNNLTPFRLVRTGTLDVLQAFMALAEDRTTSRFPGLKIGFVEAASAWVPHLLRISNTKTLEELNFYVTCEVSEDVGYLSKQLGYDHLMLGSDYTHGDRSSVYNAHQLILDRSDISEEAARCITSDSARNFYNLW